MTPLELKEFILGDISYHIQNELADPMFWDHLMFDEPGVTYEMIEEIVKPLQDRLVKMIYEDMK